MHRSVKRSHIGYMEYYRFKSIRNVSLYGLTIEKDGRNLPRDKGPWECVYGASQPGHAQFLHDIAEALKRDGFYLTQTRADLR